VPELLAKSAFGGRSITIGTTTLTEATVGPLTSVAPYPGQIDATSAALGYPFPAPNTISGPLLWAGRDLAMLRGVAPDLTGLAATTDQTGGWAALRLAGPHAADALMRHTPLDLREAAFPVGCCTRAPLNHLSIIVAREQEGFLILIFRSMAQTAWHELETALHALNARAGV